MNIIICGAGDVGRHSAEVLSPAGHNITVIDLDEAKLGILDEMIDVRTLAGDCTRADVLEEANVDGADLLIAATNIDQINLLTCAVATALGVEMCIARVHHSAFFEGQGLDYGKALGIDHLICPESTTAQAIASTLRSPGSLAIESFAQGKVEMQSFPVSDDAKAVGKQLKELKLPGARVVAVNHRGEAFVPFATTVIHAGDVVTLIGDAQNFDKTRKLFDTKADRRLSVMVMGGSALAVWLCRALKNRNMSVRLFEPDRERAEELAEKLDWITVLHADAINTDALADERVDQADAFVAVTEDDETNILAAARAKSMGGKTAIAVLQRGTYLHLLEHVGIDKAFSPRETAVVEMLRRLETGPMRHLGSLEAGIAEVYEMRLGEGSPLVGQPLREVKLPEQAAVAVIHRDDRVFVPGGDDELRTKDAVVVIAPGTARKALRKLFAG